MTPRPVSELDDRPAGLGRRFLAVLVDQAVLMLLGGGVVVVASLRAGQATQDGAPQASALPAVPAVLVVAGALLALAVAVAQWLLHGRHGWTLGRLLLGVRTVDVHSRRPIGPGRVLVRGLVVAVGALVLAVGQVVVLLSPLLDRTGRRRGWHDRAVDAEVLRVGATPPGGRRGGAAARRVVPDAEPRSPTADHPTADHPTADHPTADPQTPRGVVPGHPTPDGAAPRDPAPVGASSGPVASAGGGAAREPATATGGLVLAPLHPRRSAPDLDTRAIPLVRASPTLAFGLAPELETTRPAPPRADVVPAPRTPTTHGLRVALDDGRVLTVERLALVGRNPSPGPDVQVVRVVDPSRSVSKTHLQLAVDARGGSWVVDRGSTNGTVVTLPDGGQVVCRVDHPVRLRAGAVVVFGDRSLRVVSAPQPGATDGAPG